MKLCNEENNYRTLVNGKLKKEKKKFDLQVERALLKMLQDKNNPCTLKFKNSNL